MIPVTIDIPEAFFKEEVRCDYVVTEKMKKVWAIQLDLLDQLKRICRKYGLIYYADSGTLIGAVRHQGYIPWDDDIDIVLKRADYDELLSVAEKELSYPYFLQSAYSEEFPRGYSRLRNSETTALTRYDMGKNINHGIFIDIFPLDNMPDDPKERAEWLEKIKKLNGRIQSVVYSGQKRQGNQMKKLGRLLLRGYYAAFGYEKIFRRYEEICGMYNMENTKNISYVAYSKGKAKHIWERTCFQDALTVPFEFTDISIPAGYDSRLKVEYGDYMKIVRAATTHGELILNPEQNYKEYLRLHDEKEIAEFFAK